MVPSAANESVDNSTDESSLNPKIIGAGVAALIVAGALGWWLFSASDEPVRIDPGRSAQSEVVAADPVIDADDVSVDRELATAESALLARDLESAATALNRVTAADPNNPRLPFLTAQLEQMQLRDYLDGARVAMRQNRFEDAAIALNDARALAPADASEIELVSDELNIALSAQRVDDVLAKGRARLEAGQLISPSNDNARYYFETALSNDPRNAAATQGLMAVASKLELQARAEIDAGRFDSAEALLANARRIDPDSSELASTAAALNAARSDSAQRQRDSEQQAARQADAERQAAEQAEADRIAAEERSAEEAAAQTFAIEATAADQMTDEKTEIPADLPPPEAAANEPAAETAPPAVAQQAPPISASALNRVKYVAPKYPRAAQRRNLTGWVEVEFTVDIDGNVKNVAVINSEPGLTFVNAALTAVEKWRFEPVVENGVAVQKRAAVRMMFAVE